MESIELIISGRVQGVGYRHFVANHARSLRITGFVKNLYDGRVKVVAKGNQTALDQLIILLQSGPRFAHVCDIKHSLYLGKENFSEFSVRF
jgi:acylphosphatase